MGERNLRKFVTKEFPLRNTITRNKLLTALKENLIVRILRDYIFLQTDKNSLDILLFAVVCGIFLSAIVVIDEKF